MELEKPRLLIHEDMPIKVLLEAIYKGFEIVDVETDCIKLEMPSKRAN